MSLSKALLFSMRQEGGYTNDPDDPGGATNMGITQTEYTLYRETIGMATRDVRDLDAYEVEAIYQRNYWIPMKCAIVPEPLDLILADCALLGGVYATTKQLQRTLKVQEDGIYGPKTEQALRNAIKNAEVNFVDLTTSIFGVCAFAYQFIQVRRSFLVSVCKKDPVKLKFLAGWLMRLADLEAIVLLGSQL